MKILEMDRSYTCKSGYAKAGLVGTDLQICTNGIEQFGAYPEEPGEMKKVMLLLDVKLQPH